MEAGSSEIQSKNQEFRNQIRRRNKEDHFKRVRSEFFKLQKTSDGLSSQDRLKIDDIDSLLNSPVSKTGLERMNRILTVNRGIINESLFLKMLEYGNANLICQKIQSISQKVYLNDLIAFYSNLVLFEQFDNILKSKLNFSELTDNLLNFSLSVNQISASLLCWLLFQITLIQPEQTIPMVSQAQLQLANYIGIDNVHLSYLLSNIAAEMPELISPQIVQRFLYVEFHKDTQKQFCRNIVQTLNKFVENNRKHSLIDYIFKWIEKQLSSSIFPIAIRDDLLVLINNLLQKGVELATLTNLVSEGNIVYELVSRSLYDTNPNNKMYCISSINNLIKQSPTLQRQQLLENHPSIIKVLISSFSLLRNQSTVTSLISIALISMTFKDNMQIKQSMVSQGIISELQLLSESPNDKISELANSLKEEVFRF